MCRKSGYLDFSLKIGYIVSLIVSCYYTQYVPASKPLDHAWFDVREAMPRYCTGDLKARWFCRILDRFTRRAKPIRITSGRISEVPLQWAWKRWAEFREVLCCGISRKFVNPFNFFHEVKTGLTNVTCLRFPMCCTVTSWTQDPSSSPPYGPHIWQWLLKSINCTAMDGLAGRCESRKCVIPVVCVKLGKWYVVKHNCVTWSVFNLLAPELFY